MLLEKLSKKIYEEQIDFTSDDFDKLKLNKDLETKKFNFGYQILKNSKPLAVYYEKGNTLNIKDDEIKKYFNNTNEFENLVEGKYFQFNRIEGNEYGINFNEEIEKILEKKYVGSQSYLDLLDEVDKKIEQGGNLAESLISTLNYYRAYTCYFEGKYLQKFLNNFCIVYSVFEVSLKHKQKIVTNNIRKDFEEVEKEVDSMTEETKKYLQDYKIIKSDF